MVTDKKIKNKKVLLRERKRHTDRGVSSTPSVILYEVGYPPIRVPPQSGPMGGYLRWGTPLARSEGGTQGGVPPARSDGGTQGGVPPWSGLRGVPKVGYSQPDLMGVPGVGYPQQGYPPSGPTGGYPRWGTPWQGYPPGRGTPHLDLARVPPPLGVDRQNDGQTRVKTLPSRRTTYAVGNKSRHAYLVGLGEG